MKNVSLFCLLGLLCTFLIGCGAEQPFFDAYDVGVKERIGAFHAKNSPSALPSEKEGKPQMYIDFSDGINQAYTSNSNNVSLIKGVYNDIATSNLEVFKLDMDKINKFENPDPNVIGQKVLDPKSYNGRYAPIVGAVEQIVAGKNDAIIITDFEEFVSGTGKREEILNTAPYKNSFESWLDQGNSIHFFVSNYTEKYSGTPVEKHLYFTIFSYGKIDEKSMISKVARTLSSLKRYDMSVSNYVLSNDYGAPKTGGVYYDPNGQNDAAKNIFYLNKDSYYNGLDDGNAYEIYQFDLDWANIDKLRKSYEEMNMMNAFLDKLYLDLSNDDAFSIESVKVKVTDITDDFGHFALCNEIPNHPPKFIKDANGANQLDPNAEYNPFQEYYNMDGTIKPEWSYAPKKQKEIKSIFSLNKELFSNSKKDDNSKVPLATQFHDNFSIGSFDNPSGLLKVELVMDESKFNAANDKLNLFKWPALTKKGAVENTALLESVKSTLNSPMVEPKEHVLYTYYIKTL